MSQPVMTQARAERNHWLSWRGGHTIAAALFIGLAALEYALWLPQYLASPWWADHDVFATLAQGWDSGLRPYRDLLGNNFPGTIYFFWLVGKTWGWGNTWAYNVFDGVLLAAFGAATLLWSRKRLGDWLPGALTLFALVTYYVQLDFSQIAQRDWHAALFAALGMMAIECAAGAWGLCLSAIFLAIGVSIRPQAVMFVPGLLWTLNFGREPDQGGQRSAWRSVWLRSASWVLCLTIVVGGLFLPLVVQGVIGDFARGLRTVMPGSGYDEGKLFQLAKIAFRIVAHGKVWGLLLAMALFWRTAPPTTRRSATGWLVFLAGSLAYLEATPVLRPYVQHAFWIVWAFVLGVMVAMLLKSDALSRRTQWMALAFLCMLLDVGYLPPACSPAGAMNAIKAVTCGTPLSQTPLAYQHPYRGFHIYPYGDYQAMLAFLRSELARGTRVANGLMGVAVTGPTGRLPAFPAESATWLFVVQPKDEDRFITALHDARDSVVVWAPAETEMFHSLPARFPRLANEIRALYEPAAGFGAIEVWRRRAGVDATPEDLSDSGKRSGRDSNPRSSRPRRHFVPENLPCGLFARRQHRQGVGLAHASQVGVAQPVPHPLHL
jgi:hypothetical protein